MSDLDPIAALRHRLGAGVVTDAATLEAASVDWTGRFRGRAAALVSPRDVDEVVAVVETCARLGVGLVPQGGNTGLVAGATPLGGEVILSTRRLDRLDPVDVVAGTVVVGAGATLGAVQRHAAAAGWRYGVDFAARDSATIGGTIATNAGGIHVLRDGPTRDQLLGIEAVTGRAERVGELRALVKDNTGYHLPSLLCGSEGTLAVITAAAVKLRPPHGTTHTALLAFSTVADAVAASSVLRRATAVVAAELMLDEGIELVCRATGLPAPFPVSHRAHLLVDVEVGGDDLVAVLAGLSGVSAEAVATDSARRDRLWAYRERHTEAIGTIGSPHKLDVTVPARHLAAFVEAIGPLVRDQRPAASVWQFGHVGDGNVHVNITGVEPDDDEVDELVLRYVTALGGSISAEHGIGRAKRRWLALNRSRADRELARRVKQAFDPRRILNPGCLSER